MNQSVLMHSNIHKGAKVNDIADSMQDVKVAGYVGNNVRLAGGLNKGDILITAGLSKLVDNYNFYIK